MVLRSLSVLEFHYFLQVYKHLSKAQGNHYYSLTLFHKHLLNLSLNWGLGVKQKIRHSRPPKVIYS